MQALIEREPAVKAVVSRRSCLECRVGPVKSNEIATRDRYDAFFARPDLVCVELTPNVAELAAATRVRHRLPTTDALQAAWCLLLTGRQVLFTRDAAIERVAGLNVVEIA